MRLPRITIRTLIVVVSVVAADCAVLRYVLGDVTDTSVVFASLGVLPMVNVLAFGLCRIPSRRAEGRHFLIGFEAVGLVAALGVFVGLLMAPERWIQALDMGIYRLCMTCRPYRDLRQHMNPSFFREASIVTIGLGIIAALFTPPQLLVALAGGLLARRVFGFPHRQTPGGGGRVPGLGDGRGAA